MRRGRWDRGDDRETTIFGDLYTMGLARILQGLLWACRIGRVNRGHRLLVSLTSAGVLFLLLVSLTPHPLATPPTHAHRGVRRIQQQADDYNTAPKTIVAAGLRGDLLRSRSPILDLAAVKEVPLSLSWSEGQVEAGSVIIKGRAPDTPPPPPPPPSVINPREALAQLALDIPRSPGSPQQQQQLASAQERALAAIRHGQQITENQKVMLARLSPASRKALEQKASLTRLRQDRAYMDHLRTKRQVVPRQGGGEEIYSNPRMTVRFPALLKVTDPSAWLPQYTLFANLSHHPWVNSGGCENYSITFYPPSSHSTRALASFPSSGNTWLRYLIEGATGIFTGSLYDDTSLIRNGMYGEGLKYDGGMTVVQKSHGYTTGDAMALPHDQRVLQNHMGELSGQGVVVIRNPFKALISHRHLDVGGHTGYAPKAHFLGEGWSYFVIFKTSLWRDFYLDWLALTSPSRVHVTHYENVVGDAVGEMRKVLRYLGVAPDEGRLACLARNTDGYFKRKPSKSKSLDFNPFTRELKDVIYAAIDDVDKALQAAGKEPLPLEKYEIYSASEAKVARRLRKAGAETAAGPGAGTAAGPGAGTAARVQQQQQQQQQKGA